MAFTIVFMGCSDQLERTPVDSLVEETAYRTVGDLQLGLNGAINGYSPNQLVAFNSIFTDNIKLGYDNGGQELNTYNQILNADTGDRGLWASRYGAINDFNRLLEAASAITPGTLEVDQYNNILAQCYAFRALMHYELLLYYGFNFLDDSALGVPYVDYVSAVALPARNTTSEVLIGIQADLDNVLALLPVGTNDINFATADFVTFLRARIALESGDYPGAINFAGDIIANYPLANAEQYLAMYRNDANTVEVIWKYDSALGANLGLFSTWNFNGPGPFMEMSNELGGLLEDSDVRSTVNIDPASVPDDNEFIVGKYGLNTDEQAINDFKAMRVSEAYLIRAEAYARTMQFGVLSQNDVFAVRSIRNTSAVMPSHTSIQTALVDILAERRLELAYEGHRYTDIKRMKSVLNIGIDRDASDCVGAVPCELAINSERWIFPVPTVEINANPNIGQAAGY